LIDYGIAGERTSRRWCPVLDRRRHVVDAVLYLGNAPFVTGEILHVDGGQSAGH
jgi:hypothetical protein